jgi:hypothetical protein
MWPHAHGVLTYGHVSQGQERDAARQTGSPSGDARWAADLIDTYRARDIEWTVEVLEEMVSRLRSAAKARRMLAHVEPVVLREALGLASSLRSVER